MPVRISVHTQLGEAVDLLVSKVCMTSRNLSFEEEEREAKRPKFASISFGQRSISSNMHCSHGQQALYHRQLIVRLAQSHGTSSTQRLDKPRKPDLITRGPYQPCAAASFRNKSVKASAKSNLDVPAATSVEGRTLTVHYLRRDKDVHVSHQRPLSIRTPVKQRRPRLLCCDRSSWTATCRHSTDCIIVAAIPGLKFDRSTGLANAYVGRGTAANHRVYLPTPRYVSSFEPPSSRLVSAPALNCPHMVAVVQKVKLSSSLSLFLIMKRTGTAIGWAFSYTKVEKAF